MLLFAANNMRWGWEVSGERHTSEILTSWLRRLNKMPRKQRGTQKKETSSLLGLRGRGSQRVPLSFLYIYGAPTVYKALTRACRDFKAESSPSQTLGPRRGEEKQSTRQHRARRQGEGLMGGGHLATRYFTGRYGGGSGLSGQQEPRPRAQSRGAGSS